MPFTVTQAAKNAGISISSVRLWSKTLEEVLSSSANPPKGKARLFTEDDVNALHTVRVLKAEGVDMDVIIKRLKDGERYLPDTPTEQSEPGTTSSLVPISLVERFIGDRDRLRDELATEREARLAAEIRATKAETELEVIRNRRPWWRFWK